MAKEKTPPTASKSDDLSFEKTEFNAWLNTLQQYHTYRFDKNYRQYTAYTQTQKTHTKISDPVAPELVERVIQRMFQRDPKFYAMARGQSIPREIRKLMENIAEYLWTNPDVVQSSGTMRSKLKQVGREFCVTGNTGVETFYSSRAESPDFRVIPIEDVIFDSATSLRKSTTYYIRQYVSLDYLKSLREVTKDGRVITGRFKHIDDIERWMKNQEKNEKSGETSTALIEKQNDPTPNQINRSGANLYDRPVDRLLLVTKYQGKKFKRMIEWLYTIEDGSDPLGIGEDPLDFAMDIEVPKQPYAFSLIDFINGIIQAKDLIINQVVDYGAKALNPPLFVDPSVAPVNRATLRNAYRAGGLVYANTQQAAHQPMPELPSVGFNLLSYIQQRAESVTGVGAYLGGVPNQVSDQTKGTKGGIESLINQAQSPVADRQQNIEESIIEPVINKFLKITGEMMGRDETKWIFISGQDQKWVEVSKGLLTGKITLKDLITSTIVSTIEAVAIRKALEDDGKNPDKEILFDVDWILRVETGSMAENDTEKDLMAFNNWVAFNAQFGVPMNVLEISKEMAMRSGIKEPDQYLNEGQQGQPPAQVNPQQQAEAAKAAAQAQESGAKAQKTQVETQASVADAQSKQQETQAQIALDRAKTETELLRQQQMGGI